MNFARACAFAALVLVPHAVASAADDSSTTWADPAHQERAAPEQGARTVLATDEAERGVVGLADLLQRAPGATVRTTGGPGAPAYLSLRGSDASHVQVLLDGVPLHGGSAPAFDLSLIPVDLIARVVVWRSDAPISLGAASPGGIVDLQTRFDASSGPAVAASYGSFGAHELTASQQLSGDDHRTLIAATWLGSRNEFGFYDDNGTRLDDSDDGFAERRNAHREQVGALLRHRAQLGAWRVTALGLGIARNAGVPGPAVSQALQTEYGEALVFGAVRGQRSRWPGERVDVAWLLAGSGRWDRFDDPADELGFGSQRQRSSTATGLARAQSTVWATDALEIETVLDLQAERRSLRDELAALQVDSARRVTPGAGASATLSLLDDWLALTAGARGDAAVTHVDGDPDAVAREQTADVLWSPRAGIGVTPPTGDSPWSARAGATLGAADRAPGFDELYGDRGDRVGNPALVPEHRVGWDATLGAGYDADAVRADLSATAWRRQASDLIVYVENGVGVAVPQNVARATLRGVEAAASVAWRDRLRADASFGWLDAADDSDATDLRGRQLPYRPRQVWSASVDGNWRALYGGVRADGASSFFVDARELRPMPARVELGARLGVRVPGIEGLSATANVTNLLDTRTESVSLPDGGRTVEVPAAIADFAGYPLPGRAAYLTLAWTRR